jgi:hypothetical protein
LAISCCFDWPKLHAVLLRQRASDCVPILDCAPYVPGPGRLDFPVKEDTSEAAVTGRCRCVPKEACGASPSHLELGTGLYTGPGVSCGSEEDGCSTAAFEADADNPVRLRRAGPLPNENDGDEDLWERTCAPHIEREPQCVRGREASINALTHHSKRTNQSLQKIIGSGGRIPQKVCKKCMEGEEAKRAKVESAPTVQQPQAWPSHAELIGRGLECKAEAHTSSDSWSVEGRTWRTNFASADADGRELQQKQADMRRQLLRAGR